MKKIKYKRIKIRKEWNIHPATRVNHSRKIYTRTEAKREAEKELDEGDNELYEY